MSEIVDDYGLRLEEEGCPQEISVPSPWSLLRPTVGRIERTRSRKTFHERLGLGRLIRDCFSALLVYGVLRYSIVLAVIEVAKAWAQRAGDYSTMVFKHCSQKKIVSYGTHEGSEPRTTPASEGEDTPDGLSLVQYLCRGINNAKELPKRSEMRSIPMHSRLRSPYVTRNRRILALGGGAALGHVVGENLMLTRSFLSWFPCCIRYTRHSNTLRTTFWTKANESSKAR